MGVEFVQELDAHLNFMEWRIIELSKGKHAVSEYGDIKSLFSESKHKRTYRDGLIQPRKAGKKGRCKSF